MPRAEVVGVVEDAETTRPSGDVGLDVGERGRAVATDVAAVEGVLEAFGRLLLDLMPGST